MKITLLTSLRIIACYNIYANANPLSTPSATPTTPSTPENHNALKPITLEVASNGIIEPGHADRNTRTSGHGANSHQDDLESFPVIGIEHLSKRHHHHKNNPFRGGLSLGHGPVVQGARPVAPGGGLSFGHGSVVQGARPITPGGRFSTTPPEAYSQPGHSQPSARYLVIPLSENNRKSNSAGIPTSEIVRPNKETPSTHSNGEEDTRKPDSSKPPTIPNGEESPSKAPSNKSPSIPKGWESTSKPATSKSPSTSSGSFPTGILPTIPRCLNILKPLRDLAERLVYIKEAPHHTLMSACHFKSLNQTHYDGWHVERMRDLCWDLFETIQLEGRRRWERCAGKEEEKYQYNSDAWKEGDPIYEQESGVDKFTFHAYQLTPVKVKEFIAEHPDLSPDDIEWLTHDANPTETTTSTPAKKRSVSLVSKRSSILDIFKAIFAAEVDATIKQIGKGVGNVVTEEVHGHRQKEHAQNKTSNPHKVSTHNNSTSSAHSKRGPQSNRVYVHGQWRPTVPVNKYINVHQPRANIGLPYSSEDIDSYLEFVRETRRLSPKQYRRLRVAVERELKLNSQLLGSIENEHHSQSEDLPDKQKRSGQPPSLKSNFRRPYQWDIPSDLADNPAYINLTLAWNNAVSAEDKTWIGQQLRNVWVLRVGDLCNISKSWTKDLSEESQEIQLKFKGLDLQRCKEIKEGTRDNVRVGEYWKGLSKEEDASKKPSTRDPTLDSEDV